MQQTLAITRDMMKFNANTNMPRAYVTAVILAGSVRNTHSIWIIAESTHELMYGYGYETRKLIFHIKCRNFYFVEKRCVVNSMMTELLNNDRQMSLKLKT